MGFVLPLVIFNEIGIGWFRNVIHKVARRLGAKYETPEMEMNALLPSDTR